MSKSFGQIRQREKVFSNGDFGRYVRSIAELPDPETTSVDTCYLLTEYDQENKYAPGIIYILREIDGNKVWIDLKISEHGKLGKPRDVWKRITDDSIILRWEDPIDVLNLTDEWESATWDHDVVVRKNGGIPSSIDDGEIVLTSTVRNQYNSSSYGFVDRISSNRKDYVYVIFSITKGGVATASDPIYPFWTWPEIHDIISRNLHRRSFRVGDRVDMPANALYPGVTLVAQVVDFDYSRNFDGEKVRGITFMTEQVLGNMSFDNKELEIALTGDQQFRRNKTYLLKDSTTGEFREFDVEAYGFEYGGRIPVSRYDGLLIKNFLYEYNDSIRYFVNNDNVILDSVESTNKQIKLNQSTVYTGRSQWHISNLHTWLTGRNGITNTYIDDYITNDVIPHWSMELDPEDPNYNLDWAGVENGWFKASIGRYHDLAPASFGSARYIDKPCFIDGFTCWEDAVKRAEGLAFVNMLMQVRNLTITDQYVHRYVRGIADDDVAVTAVYSAGTSYQGAIPFMDNKFWLPSFEEIYGRRPVNGINGIIDTTYIENTHEGEQFEFFRISGPEVRVKKDLNGDPIGWYTRSCDPTTVGRVFYVPSTKVTDTSGSAVELTCTAHRYLYNTTVGGTAVVVGPAVCFTVT